jgi:cytochrome d ubiquinol oxidase subunit I
MVGCGLVMLALAWAGSWLIHKGRIERYRRLLWLVFLSFPLPHIAILTGWFTAEVGRQPWTVYGVMRTADAVTPFLTARVAAISFVVFVAVYTLIFAFGVHYIYRLLRAGPTADQDKRTVAGLLQSPRPLIGGVAGATYRSPEK